MVLGPTERGGAAVRHCRCVPAFAAALRAGAGAGAGAVAGAGAGAVACGVSRASRNRRSLEGGRRPAIGSHRSEIGPDARCSLGVMSFRLPGAPCLTMRVHDRIHDNPRWRAAR